VSNLGGVTRVFKDAELRHQRLFFDFLGQLRLTIIRLRWLPILHHVTSRSISQHSDAFALRARVAVP
jgi:hypothetical protein